MSEMYRNQRERVGPLGFDTAQTAGPTQPALLTQNLLDSALVFCKVSNDRYRVIPAQAGIQCVDPCLRRGDNLIIIYFTKQ